VRGNFLIPLFSRDGSLDAADKLTEAGSTYTIAGINAGARSHVLKMSTLKKGRNRQAFLSMRDTFSADKSAAANTASYRACMPFQDIRNQAADGSIKQFQPWMGAVVAAAMQAAAFYKAIVAKFANISGALQAAKDFDDQDDDQMEEALLAGPPASDARRRPAAGSGSAIRPPTARTATSSSTASRLPTWRTSSP
jgi:hypothetical protein